MSSDSEINGHSYRFNRMPLMVKFHVARKVAPLMADIVAANGAASGNTGLFSGIAEAVARMPQEDADMVLSACLSNTEIRQGDRWFRVAQPSGTVMYDFIDLPDVMQIVLGSLQENLGAFFPASPSTSIEGGPTSPGSISSPSPAA